MVNPGEPLINVVTSNKPKVLTVSEETTGLSQKARGQETVLKTHRSQMLHPRRKGGT